MVIRYLTSADDRLEVSIIMKKSWQYAYKGIIPQAYLDGIKDDHSVRNFDNAGWYTLVCEEDGKLVGCCTFSKSRFARYPDAGEVISIYFLPEYIGKGYGRQMLGAAVSELKKQGYHQVILWVLEENARGRRAYEKFCFVPAGDFLDPSVGGKTVREIMYIYQI